MTQSAPIPPTSWRITFEILLLSDAHVGAGINLLGGNLQGLRRDDDGFPYVPDRQVRGLLRQAGYVLRQSACLKDGPDLFKKAFGAGPKEEKANRNQGGWSCTGARYPWKKRQEAPAYRRAALHPSYFEEHGILARQAHVDVEHARFFGYQKMGGREADMRVLEGRLFSHELLTERDVAFLIACMKMDDRIGQRRSRGYGYCTWNPIRVDCDQKGQWQEDARSPEKWVNLLLDISMEAVS